MLTPARQARRPRGSVLVELAIVLPLLLVLALATVEFSQALAAYKVLVGQVRIAARHLATRSPGEGHLEARCLVTHGTPQFSASACSGEALMPGLSQPGFTVAVADATNSPATHRAQRTSTEATVLDASTINLVTVTATGYRHTLRFTSVLPGFTTDFTGITFGPVSLTMRQAN
jgi:Flp pilus assembly protein TadG